MASLSRQYFAFNMRSVINQFISMCGPCRLQTHPPSRREDDGSKIATEPNSLIEVDVCGAFNQFKSPSGRSPSYFLAIDAASRYVFTFVIYSTADAEILRCFLELRRNLNGLPSRVQCDNALLTSNSRAKQFLQQHGVSINHGHAFVSRSQSRAEKAIGSISRLIMKIHMENPSISFAKLLENSTIIYNSSPSDSLPNNLSPRDCHFVRPPTSFLHSSSDAVVDGVSKSLIESVAAARAAGEAALQHDVAAFIRRQKKSSPTNFTQRLLCGDHVLKKRSTWPVGTPKKYGTRVLADGFVVLDRVATNTYRVKSVVDGQIHVLPGDLLVKVRLDRDSLRTLCDHMNDTLSLHDQPVNKPTLRNRSDNVNVGRMFISEGNEPKVDFIGSVDSLFLESLFGVFI